MVVYAADGNPQEVMASSGFTLGTMGVRHGPVPLLASRLATDNATVAFADDQDAALPAFWNAVRGANLLIVYLAIADDRDAVNACLHATPDKIASGAAKANIKHLVLAHLMQRSLAGLDSALRTIRAHYAGRVSVATDGACLELR